MRTSIFLRTSRAWKKAPQITIQRSPLSTSVPYPVIQTCPPSTCSCAPMPADLDIDHKRALFGSIAPYHEHLLINTGTHDWPSKIEDDERFQYAADMKAAIREESIKSFADGGKPRNVLVTNSSFPVLKNKGKVSISLLKTGLDLKVPVEQTKLLISLLSSPDVGRQSLVDQFQGKIEIEEISDVVIMICGHTERDKRCGIMGPLLQEELKEKMAMGGYSVSGSSQIESSPTSTTDASCRVGLVSHIGGHVFAGNVIINIPNTEQFKSHPLAGKAVWYGRVEPRHIEGIVSETVKHGKIIQDLLRGVV
ncbi:hypothetical protein BT63DRAFT_183115 [Microthyrium microscopicum]|uniref:Altered inheritance of mitochondria protein 32 n=1 Tax=Microthyrium microscopicum TaxID=703497 RepID=A0A6A6UK96_9PEZI|nr:hypothetical protein BT63DRAFT_183115 [Microthyrium microscopicum]